MVTIKKAQTGIKQDSVKTKNDSILVNQRKKNFDAINKISDDFAKNKLENRLKNLVINEKQYQRQSVATPKKKLKNGGSLTGLKASNKRVGPVDPPGKGKKGAFTQVQINTLKGAKGKASLTKDKQLGATKMAKCGAKMTKKK